MRVAWRCGVAPVLSHRPVSRRNRRPALEALEGRALLAAPSGPEQELLEWINQFRTNPAGEFDRLIASNAPVSSAIPGVASAVSYFGVDLNLLRAELGQLSPAPPLAWSSTLQTAAAGHNQQMIAADEQSHQLPGEASLGGRATAAGYTGWNRLAENVYAYAQSVAYAHAGFVIDWGPGVGGMQSPRGHRDTLINPALREVGVSITLETNAATSVGPLVVTQDFGARSAQAQPYLLGVVYDDALGDQFYQSGEGLAGVQVTATGPSGTFQAVTTASGGYQMTLPAGSYTVTFQGGPMGGVFSRVATVGAQNVKLDLDRSRAGGVAPTTPPTGNPDPPNVEQPPALNLARVVQTTTRQATIGLSFVGDLDLSRATQRTVYTLRRAGRDGRLGTRDDLRLTAARVRYDAGRDEFQLSFNVRLRNGETVHLLVRPDAALSPLGLTLVGPSSRSVRVAARRR